MAGFGSLNPAELDPEAVTPLEETWQDREAQAALKLIEAEKANKAAAGRSWYDTINDVAHFPHRMFGQLTSARPDDPARMMPENYLYRTINNTADAIGGAIHSGITAPHDAATGELPMTDAEGHTSPKAIARAFDLASIAGGGSVAGTAERAAQSAGTDFRVLGRKIGGEAGPATKASAIKITPVASELASPYHEALEGGTTLASDSAKPGAVIAAAEHAPPFTMAAEPALGRIGRKVGTAEQWKNDLRKYGVTNEEMKYRGVDELKPGQPLSREQLATHLESSPVEIKPVVRTMPPEFDELSKAQRADIEAQWYDRFDNETRRDVPDVEEFYNALRDNPGDGFRGLFTDPNLSGGPSARWFDYQLPGGKNYRERLLTLPNRKLESMTARWRAGELSHPEIEQTQAMSAVGQFRGDHWSEPNVIVHRRSTDRQMPVPFTAEEQAAADAHAAASAKLEDLRQRQGLVAKSIQTTVKPLERARQDQIRADMKAGKMSGPEGLRALEQPVDHPEVSTLQNTLQDLRGQEDAIRKSLPPEPQQKTIKTLHDEEQQSDWHQTGREVGYRGDKTDIERALEKERDSLAQKVVDDGGEAHPKYEQRMDEITAINRKLEQFGSNPKGVPDGPFKDSWHRLALHDQIREAAEKGYDRISWTGGRSSPTNPKNLGQAGEAAAKAENGLIKHYDEKLVNAANKIGKAHGVQVEKGSIADTGSMSGEQALQRLGLPPEHWDLVKNDPIAREKLFQDARDKGHDIYHMDVPQSLKDQALQKGFLMFEDSGKAGGAIAAAEHAKPYHDLLDKAATEQPSRISTRLPTGKKTPEDALAPERLRIDMAAMEKDPSLFAHNVNLVRQYPNMLKSELKGKPHEVARRFVDYVKDNLLHLYDQVPENIRPRSAKWYEGGNKIVNDLADEHGVHPNSSAGAVAALSPQKDWYQNVDLARRVHDIHFNQRNTAYSPQMAQTAKRIFADPKFKTDLNRIKGKTYGELNDGLDKAMWLRLYDEAHNPRTHRLVTPEGEFGDVVRNANGNPSGTGWGSLVEIGKAIKSLEANGDVGKISSLMGERHKVRNFYNNLIDPHSPHGDVTIDTHAVAAGLFRPLSGNSMEVAHNFGNYPGKDLPTARSSAVTGVGGTYGLYADAYREAAKARGISPREMQSITWEAIRGLFKDTWKGSKKNIEAVDGIWRKYQKGLISKDDARQQITTLAGGIEPPSWHGHAGGERRRPAQDAARRDSADPQELLGAGVPDRAARGVVGRAGSRAAAKPKVSFGSLAPGAD